MTLHLPDHAAPGASLRNVDAAQLSRRGILILAAAATLPVVGAAPALAATSVVRFTTTTSNVRSGAGTGYAIVGTLRKGTRVTGTLTSNGWVKIATGKYVGGSVLTSSVIKVTRWTIASTVVRSGPSTGNAQVGTLKAGTKVYGWWTESQGWFRVASGQYVQASALTATAPAGAGTTGSAVISECAKYEGIYYTWGGSSPSTGFDCSGYSQYVHKQLGISIPRTVADQRAASVPVSTRKVGHLVVFGTYHVAMYAGNGYIWDSSKPGYPIRKRQLWTSDVSYRAVPGVSY